MWYKYEQRIGEYGQMAEPDPERGDGAARPRTIRDLCQSQQREFPQVTICCHYCRIVLSVLDLYAFEQSGLSLLWREGLPTGICVHCCRVLARLEFTARHQISCAARSVPGYTGQDIVSLEVRCLRCLTRLQTVEKEFIYRQNVTVHKIGNNWRGLCVRCTLGLY